MPKALLRPALLIAATAFVLIAAPSSGPAGATGAGHSIVAVETAGPLHTAIALDANGYPVVSYIDAVTDTLKVLHCSDANCESGNSIQAVLNVGGLGDFTSLVLDVAGNPVVAFKNSLPLQASKMHILHCDDPDCSPGGESVKVPDPTIGDLVHPSIVLDASGNPVASYRRRNLLEQEGVLRLLHCDDPNCDPLVPNPTPSGEEPIGGTDLTAGTDTSLKLDASGFPVIAYASDTSPGLKVVHCNEPLCVGDDAPVNTHRSINVDWVSLELDASGLPVVAYNDETNDVLRVIHCDDATCDCPVDPCAPCPPAPCLLEREKSHIVDTGQNIGQMVDLELDAAGNPVLAYYDDANADLKVVRCGNADCSAGNTTNVPDATGSVGSDLALVLDANDYPVISYSDVTETDLDVLHCADPVCDDDADDDGCRDQQETDALPQQGGMRDPKNFWDFFDVPAGPSLVRDGSISATDIFAVLGRFNTTGDSGIDPLSMPPASGYHTAYDRGDPVGPDVWDLGPANGSIAATDIFGVLGQFNHSCA